MCTTCANMQERRRLEVKGNKKIRRNNPPILARYQITFNDNKPSSAGDHLTSLVVLARSNGLRSVEADRFIPLYLLSPVGLPQCTIGAVGSYSSFHPYPQNMGRIFSVHFPSLTDRCWACVLWSWTFPPVPTIPENETDDHLVSLCTWCIIRNLFVFEYFRMLIS